MSKTQIQSTELQELQTQIWVIKPLNYLKSYQRGQVLTQIPQTSIQRMWTDKKGSDNFNKPSLGILYYLSDREGAKSSLSLSVKMGNDDRGGSNPERSDIE